MCACVDDENNGCAESTIFRAQINTIKLLIDTISLTTNTAKLVPVFKFISNIDVRREGTAPGILTEQMVPSCNIFYLRSVGTI